MSKIRIVVWGEYVHEQRSEAIRKVYSDGMHTCIAKSLESDRSFEVSTANLHEPEHGLAQARLEETDVLTWWGHVAHHQVEEGIVDRVQKRVLEGMGLIVLHSGHYSKIFKRLMGTTCSLIWREAGEKERVWACNPGHPIAQGVAPYFEIPAEEMYGEPFGIPHPDETVFISWFQGGEVFRSGCCWKRGNGKIFSDLLSARSPDRHRERHSLGGSGKLSLARRNSQRQSFSGGHSARMRTEICDVQPVHRRKSQLMIVRRMLTRMQVAIGK
jgi:trehalose utilization protein